MCPPQREQMKTCAIHKGPRSTPRTPMVFVIFLDPGAEKLHEDPNSDWRKTMDRLDFKQVSQVQNRMSMWACKAGDTAPSILEFSSSVADVDLYIYYRLIWYDMIRGCFKRMWLQRCPKVTNHRLVGGSDQHISAPLRTLWNWEEDPGWGNQGWCVLPKAIWEDGIGNLDA